MAQEELHNLPPTFPVGTTVGAYEGVIDDSGEPKPVGPVLDSSEVAPDGSLFFDSLPGAGTSYVAAAKVGGAWRFRYFFTPGGGGTDIATLEALLEEHEAAHVNVHGIPNTSHLTVLNRHGSEAAAARINGVVNLWIGTVVPENMLEEDVFIDEGPLTAEDVEGVVSAAEFAVEKAAREAHEADTTGVHGIADTSKLVTGPAAATGENLASFNGITGKIIKDSGLSLDTSEALGASNVKIPSQKAVKAYADLRELLANKDTDVTLAANSDTKYPSQKAIKAYVDGLLAASDAVIFKGAKDCSANPNYPAASAGHLYRVSVAGKIGGAAGTVVEVGDTFMCNTDGTAEGTQAEVGIKWNVIQTNIDGAVVGPAAATSGDFPTFNGSTGKILQDSGLALDTGGLATNSDTKIPSQKAVKTYVDAGLAGKQATLGAESIEEAMLKAAAVTGPKIGEGAVSATKIGALAVTTEKIGGLAVTAAKLNGEAVETAKIKAKAIVASKLGDLGQGTRHMAENYFPTGTASNAPGAKAICYVPIQIPHACTLTGLTYEVGATSNGKVIAALYDAAGNRLRTSLATAQSTAEFFQRVPFEATIELEPGIYFIALLMESATGTCWASFSSSPTKKETAAEVKAPATFVPPTEVNNTGARFPYLATY